MNILFYMIALCLFAMPLLATAHKFDVSVEEAMLTFIASALFAIAGTLA